MGIKELSDLRIVDATVERTSTDTHRTSVHGIGAWRV